MGKNGVEVASKHFLVFSYRGSSRRQWVVSCCQLDVLWVPPVQMLELMLLAKWPTWM
jgi:hypothetical protein